MLPTFFLIGAAKCGTTSLYRYLGLHPEVYVPATKEPGFFCREEDGPFPPGHVATRAEYEALFESEALIRGDCTTAYSQYPLRSGVPKRISDLVPGARFLYLVRDPVARVVAQVQHDYSTGRETRSLRTALGQIDDPFQNRYLAPTLYATQVEQYHEMFRPERVLVVDSADLKHERACTLSKIFRFLGVDKDVASPGFSVEFNPSQGRRLPSRRYARLRNSRAGGAWRRLPQHLRAPIGRRVMRTLTSPAPRPGLDDDLRLALEDIFRPEVKRLRNMTGLSFERWSV